MRFSELLDSLRRTWEVVQDSIPAVVGAVLLLILGWGAARLLSRALASITERALARLAATSRVGDAIETSGARGLAPTLVSRLVFWLVLAAFAIAAVQLLGLPVLGDLLAQLSDFLPKLVGATIILLGGLLVARIIRAAVIAAAHGAGLAHSSAIGAAVHAVVLVMVLVIALEELGVNGHVLEQTLVVAVGSTLAAAALAFGLGARTAAANIIAARYVVRFYRVGQPVRIEGVEGTIVQLTPTAVVVDTGEGRAIVPATRFTEVSSVLLPEEP